MKHVVSLSGGKDSVALWLWARRTGLDPIAVYQDTGWEWDGHYKHLDLLEARIGPIVRLRAPKTFEELDRDVADYRKGRRMELELELRTKREAAVMEAKKNAQPLPGKAS